MVGGSEWKTVTPKHKQKTQSKKNISQKVSSTPRISDKTLLNNLRLTQLYDEVTIRNVVNVLRNSQFLSETITRIRQSVAPLTEFDTIVGLGIGPFTSSSSSLLQFAMFICLEEFMSRSSSSSSSSSSSTDVAPSPSSSSSGRCRRYIFDPTMTEADQAICANLGISVLQENKRGRHDCSGNTLFFMPHCPYGLYGSLLWQNWNVLSSVYILGNSFESYSERRSLAHGEPTGAAADQADTVRRLTPFVRETAIWYRGNTFVKDSKRTPDLAHLENAFCDLSLMHFNSADRDPDEVEAMRRVLSRRASEQEVDRATLLDKEIF